jgi:hypothetical protein
VDPLLLFVESWWWVAPAAAGAGAATYLGVTARTRRARHLEVDAARHDVRQAQRALAQARARVHGAQAEVMGARAAGAPSGLADARRELQTAKAAERQAALALRASRARVKAGLTNIRASSTSDPLPIDRLCAEHDAINARWLVYETDLDMALKYPKMTDSRHPATVTFLQAQRDAQAARPSQRAKVTPADYARYRAAVHDLGRALDEAEHQAGVPGVEPPIWAPLTDATDAIASFVEKLPSLLARIPRRNDTGSGPGSTP